MTEIKTIGRIYNDFTEKFGIPHQSGRLNKQRAKIVFEPEYRIRRRFGAWRNIPISG